MNKQEVKQKARLVYIHEPDSSDCMDCLFGQDTLKIKITDNFKDGINIVRSFKPDVVMIDYLLMVRSLQETSNDIKELLFNFKDKKIRSKPAVIVLFPSYPDPETRAYVLGAGADDFLIVPFLFKEFQIKMKIHLERSNLNQKILWQKKKLVKAFEADKKLKTQFIKIRKAFFEEKNILHNSLKQINIMSLERDRLKKQLSELDISFHDNVKWIQSFLIKMIESRNEKNKGHSKRVADIAVFVAKGLGVKQNDIEAIEKAGMLHELGMLFIPGSIFLKDASSLSVYEKDLFEKVPVFGADLLEKCKGFKKIAEIIRYLNENVDGSGIPEGLKRRYIPLLSRILAGADLLDDLLSEPGGTSADEILSRLEACAGERLDPNVVNYLERYLVICLNKSREKVREVGLYQLKPGMRTGAGLFTSTGTKLFSAGTVLTEESINMVVKYNMAYPVKETVIIKVE